MSGGQSLGGRIAGGLRERGQKGCQEGEDTVEVTVLSPHKLLATYTQDDETVVGKALKKGAKKVVTTTTTTIVLLLL